MKHRLNDILNNCNNKKFRTGFIKYLRSLDFDEFEKISNHYTSILIKLIFRYRSEKIKFLSKKWFKNQFLNSKFLQLNLLFNEANYSFVSKINSDMKNDNLKKSELLSKMKDIQEIMVHLNTKEMVLSENPTMYDKIDFSILIVDNIYTRLEMQKLLNEINRMK